MTEPIVATRRRAFSAVFAGLRLAGAAFAAVAAATAFAQGALREGVNYTVVKPPQPTTAAPGKVEVIEFFGYWCPHCNEFEPSINDWARRNDSKITFVHVPIAFAPQQANLQKLYYALDALGKEKELRGKIFTSIHSDRSLPPTPDAGVMADWAEKNGIDKKKFIDTLNSFTVQTKVTRANQIASAYGVTAVPMLAMGGKYLLTIDPRSIGNADVFLGRVISEK